MKIFELLKFFENVVPSSIAWEKDNVGLQVGSRGDKIKNITIALELDSETIRFAIKNNSNLIITHHPFIFQPIKSITTDDPKGRIISELISNKINLICLHTNLDFIRDGVSFSLAKKLGLLNIKFLRNNIQKKLKLATFVPEKNAENLIKALSESGAGIIGEYSECSFNTPGLGTFRGSMKSNPTIGEKGKFEIVEEIKVEMIFDEWNKEQIIETLYKNHPYEEPAYDIYKLENDSSEFGFGAYGELEKKLTLSQFIDLVKTKLKVPFIKYTSNNKRFVKRIGVCGGAGKDLIKDAIKNKCDVFLTSEIGYHNMFDYSEKIVLMEIEHNYSEYPILATLNKKLSEHLNVQKENIKIKTYYPKKEKIKIYK